MQVIYSQWSIYTVDNRISSAAFIKTITKGSVW